MYLIEEVLVSDDVFQKKFVCNLDKCKGACCWEGDFGAPITDQELQIIEGYLDLIKDVLSEESLDRINSVGFAEKCSELDSMVTTLMPDGACVFLTKDSNGIAKCGIEQTYEAGKIDYKKPISCHLYPIRAADNEQTGFRSINYDQWDICSAACSLGEELKVPVFRFAKDAIERKYGIEFYRKMEEVYVNNRG